MDFTQFHPSGVRDELTEMIRKDLLGPAGGPDEELPQEEDHVYGRYLVGMLAPKNAIIEPGEMDDLAEADSDDPEAGATDNGAVSAPSFFPSSMGISFVVDLEEDTLLVDSEWGVYKRVHSETQVNKKSGRNALVWKRTPMVGKAYTLKLEEGGFGPFRPCADQPEVVLAGRIRKQTYGWVVTVFLINGQQEAKKRKDEEWLFQPKLAVHHPEGKGVFQQRHSHQMDFSRLDRVSKEESETLEMLYRCQKEFAVGHGVATHVTVDPQDNSLAVKVETEFLPQHDVAQQTPRNDRDDELLSGMSLDMKELAFMPREDLLGNLRVLETAYGQWIAGEAAKIKDPAAKLQDHQLAAHRAVKNCRRALERIREGIQLIESDPVAEQSFRFANHAMWLQRTHSIFARQVRKKALKPEDALDSVDEPKNRSWRLFQLAFILINLPSLTNLNHKDRSHETDAVADLLWFATGGGKTEAYLGLTAYTLAMRRLQKDVEGRAGDHGVAVLMRYTLRLLTLQQFQRAAALMCACEVIRRENTQVWGTVPFRLGLWVGAKTTPNTLKDAAESLRQSRNSGGSAASGTPLQITSCPWCGREITSSNMRVYEAPSDVGRCATYCSDPLGECEFSEARSPREGLPVMVVDEEIYRRPPSLLIATVDKFAQMAWKGQVQMLFGKVNGYCPRHGFLSPEIEGCTHHPSRNGLPGTKQQEHGHLRPPDLIIQDELHLISGPLGSMVGLYEAAIDELCSWQVNGKRVRPKVVASTATIRRAADQVKKLFLRKLEVFPPQGTDIQDSFFALQRPTDDVTPGRRYLGICAFGQRYPAALIRVYVAIMGGAQALYNKYDQLADPYMTVTAYFNSIRELGGSRRWVEDSVKARLKDIDQRGLAPRKIRFNAVEELTSRKSGSDIPKILERLEVPFNQQAEKDREIERKANGRSSLPTPYDVILATNMISVGVDIERLGVMIVAGQPKNTSEYIQASSRVGRSASGPGLVCTLYNWARPRDLSHYERFEHYHETFYKHVEALSVTPFAPRALDKGLSGVLVSMMRLFDEHLNSNAKAGELEDTDPVMQQMMDRLVHRAENATDNLQVAELMRNALKARREDWLKRVHNQKDHKLGYQATGEGVVGLIEQPGSKDWDTFTCLNSLRDVENTVDLLLDTNPYGMRPLENE